MPRGRPPKTKQPIPSPEVRVPKPPKEAPRNKRKASPTKDLFATPSPQRGNKSQGPYTTPLSKANAPPHELPSPATPSQSKYKSLLHGLRARPSAPSTMKGKKRLAEDPLYRIYEEAGPHVNAILWPVNENDCNGAERKLRQINTQAKKLGLRAIDINVLVNGGNELMEAAQQYIRTEDTDPYLEAEKQLNFMLGKLGYPDQWQVDIDKFTNFATKLKFAPIASTRSVTDMSAEEEDERGDIQSDDPFVYGDVAQSDHSPQGSHTGDHRPESPEELPSDYDDINTAGLERPAASTRTRQSDNRDRRGSRFPGELSSDYYESDSSHDHAEEVEASQRTYTSYADLRREIAKDWGIADGNSKVLAWRPNGKVGYSVVAAYEQDGVRTARVEAAGRRPFPRTKKMHIAYQCRGKKKRSDGRYWHEDHIIGIGLVAWRVEAKYIKEPTAILRPAEKAWYPETYVNILWNDNVWTWESRDNFRFIRGGRGYETDIYIYRIAIAQEGNYQEKLTGVRPQYPDASKMKNQHWRNVNAAGEAYWKQPRARRDRRIVNVDEERLTDMEEESVADAHPLSEGGESLEDFIDDREEVPETEYAESVGEGGRSPYGEAVSEEYDSQSENEPESQQNPSSNRRYHQNTPWRGNRDSYVAETVERRRSSSSRLLPQRHHSQARDGLSTSQATSRGHASRQRDTVSRYQTKGRPRPPHTPPRSRTETPRAMQEQSRSKKSRSRSAVPPLSPISEADGGRRGGGEPRKRRGHSERSSHGDSASKESSYRGHQRKAASMPRERERESSKSASQRQSGKFRRSR